MTYIIPKIPMLHLDGGDKDTVIMGGDLGSHSISPRERK
jgi:hypothetical protein